MLQRLVSNWVYGGFLAGLMLVALAPVILADASSAATAIFLLLPAYMVHQYEEHENNRFGDFVNETIGGGRTVLTPVDIFVVNVPGVWGVNVASIWLAHQFGPGFGLIGVYLVLVNAPAHIGQAILMRRYNPGLVSAVALFLPVGVWALWQVQATGQATAVHHVLGLATAIIIHAAIAAKVARTARRSGEVRPLSLSNGVGTGPHIGVE